MRVRVPGSLRLPAQLRVEVELLKLLVARSRPLMTTEIYRALAEACGVTLAQREARAEGSADPAWHWQVRRAMQRIENEGWAYRPQRGQWAATANGRALQRAREQAGTSKVVGTVDDDLFAG